ncbi:MAG: hypothetical protein AAFO07_11820 [Bacteroidota bacterium]
MKTSTIFFFAFLCTTFLHAQPPSGINYQAVARNADGEALVRETISVEFQILKGRADGSLVYSEFHKSTTDNYGQFSAVIGQGTPGLGSFDDVGWYDQIYFLKVIIEEVEVGTTQFMSVPYAMAAGPRRGVASVPGAVFTPNRNVGSWYNSVGQGGAEITAEGSSTNVLNGPITLPHGSQLTKITAYFKDESLAEDLSIRLYRESFEKGSFSSISEILTSGDTKGWQNQSIDIDHVVNNEQYGYFIRVFCSNWDAEGTKAIKGVKVEYIY